MRPAPSGGHDASSQPASAAHSAPLPVDEHPEVRLTPRRPPAIQIDVHQLVPSGALSCLRATTSRQIGPSGSPDGHSYGRS
jgi:hypothetical protein